MCLHLGSLSQPSMLKILILKISCEILALMFSTLKILFSSIFSFFLPYFLMIITCCFSAIPWRKFSLCFAVILFPTEVKLWQLKVISCGLCPQMMSNREQILLYLLIPVKVSLPSPFLKKLKMGNEECTYRRPNLFGIVEVPIVPLQILNLTKLTKSLL